MPNQNRVWGIGLYFSLFLLIMSSSALAADQSSTPPTEQKQTLKDFMLKKGMMTEEEAKTIQESPVTLKYGSRGFELATTDRKFTLAISGRLQLLYTSSSVHDTSDMPTTPTNFQSESSFRVRRAKLAFNGNTFGPDLIYKVQLELAGSGVVLDDAYIDWQRLKWAQVMVGQYKVPFNRQQINSTATLHLVDRAITDTAVTGGPSATFSQARDIGITIHSPIGKELAEYYLGFYNGAGRNTTRNENTGHLYLARLVFYPLGPFAYYSEPDFEMTPTPKLGIGAAYDFDSRALKGLDPTTFTANDRVDSKTGTLEAVFKFHGISLISEVFQRVVNPITTTPAGSDLVRKGYGVNTQAGVFVIPQRLEIVGRWAVVDPDNRVAHNKVSETGGGINLYFVGHNLKLQTDYRRIRAEQPASALLVVNDQVRTQLQVTF